MAGVLVLPTTEAAAAAFESTLAAKASILSDTLSAERHRMLWEQAVDIMSTLHYEPNQQVHASSHGVGSELDSSTARLSAVPWGCSLHSRASTYDAIRVRLGELNDPYSRFLEPDEFDAELHPYRHARKISGVGIVPERSRSRPGALHVLAVVPESPAEEAGINPGDELVMIDDIALEPSPLNPIPITPDEALALLRGPAGTGVRLTVRQIQTFSGRSPSFSAVSGEAATPPIVRSFALTRRPLYVAPAVYGVLPNEPAIGYIRIHTFNANATDIFFRAIQAFTHPKDRPPIKGIILDLRNCRGGVFQEAMVIASALIGNPDAVLVYTVDSRGLERVHRVRDQWGGWSDAYTISTATGTRYPAYDGPLVVLVNGASASSSEALAVALRDHERAVLIGTPTFGKARIQHYFPLLDGSALVLTVGEYLGPEHERIVDHVGLMPSLLCNDAPRPFEQLNKHHLPDDCINQAVRLAQDERSRLAEGTASEPGVVTGRPSTVVSASTTSRATTPLPRTQT
jgi:carboxyl-terminal processing protease